MPLPRIRTRTTMRLDPEVLADFDKIATHRQLYRQELVDQVLAEFVEKNRVNDEEIFA